ncbi:MAG: hypothetical protein CBB97_10185 [Candidatus Endolissoclinum sp. TMED37]|nr:MAG: hypothetical protein CBB97_10185 [Candidatus Endolissoclinum sp. TMED37]|tara:strand:- start:981 stop:1190 length:210 start_codon:yes stop_codon:yes gene_type:complete
MKQFKYAIANPIERYVFCSVPGREDLVKIKGFFGGLDPTVSYLNLDDARNEYRRLMSMDQQFKVTPYTD